MQLIFSLPERVDFKQIVFLHQVQISSKDTQLEHFGLLVIREATDVRDRDCINHSISIGSLNVLPGAFPDSTDNPIIKDLICHWECYSLIDCGGYWCDDSWP
ncbi:hypothetical protein Tco_1516177 [Tanacetum coccineum]